LTVGLGGQLDQYPKNLERRDKVKMLAEVT